MAKRPTRQLRRAVDFTEHLGIQINSPEPGRSAAEVVLQPNHLNIAGTAHGGFLMTMLDTLMGRAVFTQINASAAADAWRWFATSHLTTHFLEAVSDGKLTGEGRVVSEVDGFLLAEAEIRSENGTLVATGQGQFTRVRQKE